MSHTRNRFCETCNLTNLIKHPICYKNPDNPMCIDLILTNIPCAFQGTCVIETGLSDFHLKKLATMRESVKHTGLESLNIGHLNIFPK